VHRLNNQLNPLLPHDNDEDEEMGSGVFMVEGDDDMEVNGPEDIPPKEEEEDEELEPASDEDGREIFDNDSENDAYSSHLIAMALELSFVPSMCGSGAL
jgi:hypothetical protein